MPDYLDLVPTERLRAQIALSPDAETVAYSSNAAGTFDLWTIPVVGGPPRRLTCLQGQAVRQIAWWPDGESLVFTADRNGDEQYRIYRIDADGHNLTELSTGPDCQRILADDPFSPGGHHLLYAANDRDRTVQDILIRHLTDGTERRVIPPDEINYTPARTSPDGRWLLAAGFRSNTDIALYLIDLTDADLKATCVTSEYGSGYFVPGPWTQDSAAFHLCTDAWGEFTSIGRYTVNPACMTRITQDDWDVEHIEAAGDLFVWSVNHGGHSVLRARRKGTDVELPDVPQGVIDAIALSPDGHRIVLEIDTATRPSEIGVLDLATGFRYLTDVRPPALQVIDPVEPDLITYPASNGRRVHALLYRPHAPGPHPVVLSVHGGPEAQERPEYAYAGLYQYLLHRGIAVLAPNIAGSTGYGLTHQKLIYRDWGGIDLDDLDHAIRHLHTLPGIDVNRLAVMGGSYGGFAALSCLSRLPYRWAAGVSFCGPSNLVTLAQACPPTWRPTVDAVLGNPDADAEHLTRRSPITYADTITTPLLVIQGAHDPRVPKDESDQIVAKLRTRGIDVRYDIYSDEGHGFTNRANEIKAYGDIAQFLLAHLTGE
ncbi:S9 family peptidase [Actinomadura fibrosa]|uniref:S9 family peptidase n=1 Tax=Actinomadura fibrosa TaxID=111802 RepID=A0ABW2Y317_9ACTN|nr:S9 family peptidase [Actinomadura fibrosa]